MPLADEFDPVGVGSRDRQQNDWTAPLKNRAGDEVEIAVHDGVIVVAQAMRVRGRCNLKELVARIRRYYKPHEVDSLEHPEKHPLVAEG